jgi:hypothetical protein
LLREEVVFMGPERAILSGGLSVCGATRSWEANFVKQLIFSPAFFPVIG